MSKFILIFALILIIGFTLYQTGVEPLDRVLLIFEELKEQIIPEEEGAPEEEKGGVSEEETVPEEEFIPSERAEKFYISGGKTLPVFTKEVIVDPFKVKEGEEQIFSIWAKDPQGIKKVTATTKTDTGEEVMELELVEGDSVEGRWMGSWITKNISESTSYSTNFQALNKEGKDTQATLFWKVEK